MKILICTTHPVFTGTGGAEHVFWNMANHFNRAGHEVVCLGLEKGTDPSRASFYMHDPVIKVLNPARFYKKSIVVTFLADLHLISSENRRTIRDSKESLRIGHLIETSLNCFVPDLVISHSIDMTYILKKGTNIRAPIVTLLHCDIETLLKGKQRYFKELSESIRIVVLQKSYIKELKKFVPVSQAIYIPNEVPITNTFCNTDAKIIIMTGRICPQKNQLQAIKAFSIFSSKNPDWKMVIIGDQKYNPAYFEQCVNECIVSNLNGKIQFEGVKKDVMKELLNGSIFLFPSIFEGFPLSLTEAMEQGLSCICLKDCPGVNEIIEDNLTGFLVENNPEAIASKLNDLSNNRELRIKLGKSAKEKMKEFSSDKIWSKWDKLIADVTDELD